MYMCHCWQVYRCLSVILIPTHNYHHKSLCQNHSVKIIVIHYSMFPIMGCVITIIMEVYTYFFTCKINEVNKVKNMEGYFSIREH